MERAGQQQRVRVTGQSQGVTVANTFAQNPDWWTRDAHSSGTLHQGTLHNAEELSDDVLAAIEGTF
jgi:hypothetical protein